MVYLFFFYNFTVVVRKIYTIFLTKITEHPDFPARLPLQEKNLPENPMLLFKDWFNAFLAYQPLEPYVMVLSTVSEKGPSARVVYLREYTDNSLVFYTHYHSKKGSEIQENPWVHLLFYFAEQERQIHGFGRAIQKSRFDNETYFSTRPRESQLGAWASVQSSVLKTENSLHEKMAYYQDFFKDLIVPCPSTWGGYQVELEQMEFWQGQPARLHDRILYQKQNDQWIKKRLSP